MIILKIISKTDTFGSDQPPLKIQYHSRTKIVASCHIDLRHMNFDYHIKFKYLGLIYNRDSTIVSDRPLRQGGRFATIAVPSSRFVHL